MVRKSIGGKLYVRLRNKTEVEGRLIGYDDHLNMMIDDALIRKQGVSQLKNLMYLRGDTILLLAKRPL
jgi:small nuclear ribonucleoprotein (snRNP)-like protein